jgi:hypothetical protein
MSCAVLKTGFNLVPVEWHLFLPIEARGLGLVAATVFA